MITLYGDCEKQDLSVILAIALSCKDNSNYGIMTDRKRNYSYFNDEISGISLKVGLGEDSVLHDMHTSTFSDGTIYAVTDGSPQSISSILNKSFETDSVKVIYINTGSKEGELAVKNIIGSFKMFTFPYSKSRQVDLLNLGGLKASHIDKEVELFLKDFFKSEFELSKADLSSLVKGVRRSLK